MPTLTQIENTINTNIDRRIKKFARLVLEELNIDLSKVNRDQLRVLKGKLTRFIKKAGLDSLSSEIIVFFDAIEINAAKNLNKDTKISLEELNKKAIKRAELVSELGLLEDIDKIDDGLKKRMRKGLQVQKIKGLTKKELVEYIQSLTVQAQAQTKTAVRTSVAGYDRAVTTAKANSVGLFKFRYAGADNSKNRPFCAKRVGKIYTDSQAKRWRNGQKEPADIYLGGYNCVHRKVYIVD